MRETRRRAEITQATLAERFGVSLPYVTNVERARERHASANIATALGAGLEIGIPLPSRDAVVVGDTQLSG